VAALLFFLFVCSSLQAETASSETAGTVEPAPVEAEAPLPAELGAGMPREELREILERSAGSRQKTWGIRFKDTTEGSRSWMEIPWLEFFQKAGAWILRGMLVLLIAALILAAGIYAYRRRGRFRSPDLPSSVSRQNPAEAPPPLALLEEARRLYRQGLFRDAWGLCYTAALGAFKQRWGLRFPPGATEYRCLALVRRWAGQGRLGPGDVGPVGVGSMGMGSRGVEAAFAVFIRRWVAFFYGGILPPEGTLEEALAWVESLCKIPVPAEEPARVKKPVPMENPGGAAGGIHG
jgi:hypothetical protein